MITILADVGKFVSLLESKSKETMVVSPTNKVDEILFGVISIPGVTSTTTVPLLVPSNTFPLAVTTVPAVFSGLIKLIGLFPDPTAVKETVIISKLPDGNGVVKVPAP